MSINASNALPFYHAATPSHVAASAEALAELSQLVTVAKPRAGARPLYFRFAHYEHGSFLNHELFGFPILGTRNRTVARSRPKVSRAVADAIADEWEAAGLASHLAAATATEGTQVLTPDFSSEEEPFEYAIGVHSAVDRQIETALTALASALGRREASRRFLETEALDELEVSAGVSDKEAVQEVADTIRLHGWRAAARQISSRSQIAEAPLVVEFRNPLFSPDRLAARAPILRRVYNDLPEVRRAIDVVATALSQGLTIVGNSTDRQLRTVLDAFDVGALRSYSAHVARDAFVCGNGYLAFSPKPDSDMRLLAPEDVQSFAKDGREVVVADKSAPLPVLHLHGAEQVGSPFGVGQAEPFVAHLAQLDALASHLYIIHIGQFEPGLSAKIKGWSKAELPVALRMIDDIKRRIRLTLGRATEGLADPPPDLYFPGHELMKPAPTLYLPRDHEQNRVNDAANKVARR